MKKYAKEFRISTEPQRSPGWYRERAGLPSSSGLAFLFDTLKDGVTPSAKAKKYLKQLAFERQFGVTYEKFDTKAMQDGRFYEDFAKLVYQRETGNEVSEAFSYVSDWFVATPDGHVTEPVVAIRHDPATKETHKRGGGKGLLECKILGDESFMTAMEEGLSIDHERQTQSQLMASGLDWVDYIVVNLKTRAYFIQRVHRNNTLIKRIYERLHEPLDLPELQDVGVKRFDESLMQEFMGEMTVEKAEAIIKDLPF
jgi:hypothetical protein